MGAWGTRVSRGCCCCCCSSLTPACQPRTHSTVMKLVTGGAAFVTTLRPSMSPGLSTALLPLPILAPLMKVPLVDVSVTNHSPCCKEGGREGQAIREQQVGASAALKTWGPQKAELICVL